MKFKEYKKKLLHKKTDVKKYILNMKTKELWTFNFSDKNNESTKALKRSFYDLFDRIQLSTTASLSKEALNITKILGDLPLSYYITTLHYLDDNHPGLVFHYFMEARKHQYINNGDDDETIIASQTFLSRLHQIKEHQFLNLIFSPMRTRLISELLEEDKINYTPKDQLTSLIEFKNVLETFNNIQNYNFNDYSEYHRNLVTFKKLGYKLFEQYEKLSTEEDFIYEQNISSADFYKLMNSILIEETIK